MKAEELLKYIENDENFERIDPFAEFISGVDNVTLIILLSALNLFIYEGDPHFAQWMEEAQAMKVAALDEYIERGLTE